MSEVKTRTRVCDQCGADLTRTDGAYDWHYVLSGEFTPSTSMIGYDPHPEPPDDRHFCDNECLGRWIVGQDFAVSPEMFDVGGKAVAATGKFESIGNYAEQRRFAIDIFKTMWKARPTSLGKQERAEG